jgi:flagellar hook-associated protein 1 FlgK
MADTLGIALSGLQVSQRGIEVVANNITNASVPGFTRKIMPTESQVADGMGIGVMAGEIQRYVDQSILRDYRAQLSNKSYYTTRESFLSRALSLHGSTELQSNIGANYGQLLGSFIELSASPDSRALQTAVVNDAQQLANTFNNLSQEFLGIRNEVQANLKSEVSTLNSLLRDMASYNRKISNMAATGRSVATLEDQRDEIVKKVSQLLDVTYYDDGNHVLVLQTREGQVLADGDAREVRFDAQQLTYQTYYPQSMGGLEVIDSAGNAIDLLEQGKNPGGRLGALFDLRDKELPQYMVQLDELAHKTMMRFDAQGLRLFTDATGVVPGNFPSVYAGISATIRVNESVRLDPSLLQRGTAGGSVAPGSNQTIQDVIEHAFGKYVDDAGTPNVAFNTIEVGYNRDINLSLLSNTEMTLEEFARSMIDHQAESYTNTKESAAVEEQYLQEVEKRFLDSSGVSTDEEMIKMIELQKTYQASAKMVSTLDELFRELMQAF